MPLVDSLPMVIERGRQYIASQQRTDGGFDGLASSIPNDFSASRHHPTIFFTALIAYCCSALPDNAAIIRPALEYLRRHRGADGAWNYWQRDAAGQAMRGYPDDLDDTACALLAEAVAAGTPLDGQRLGQLAQLLVTAEVKPGGPYETWLVGQAQRQRWHDVDIAVNANVAALLAAVGVTLPAVRSCLQISLRNNSLASAYYCGPLPTLYFMARIKDPELQADIQAAWYQQLPVGALDYALLLSAGCRSAIPRRRLQPLAEHLTGLAGSAGDWPAAALYLEPAIGGVQYYAGSSALTTAFACEALQLFAARQHPPARPLPGKSQPSANVYRRCLGASRQYPWLYRQYAAGLRRVRAADHDGQISRLPAWFNADCAGPMTMRQLDKLAVASVNGWLAYTLYDDMLDGQTGAAASLSAANYALRQCLAYFRAALPNDPIWLVLVGQVLDVVDEANAWEQRVARRPIRQGKLWVGRLPDYGGLDQLANKSWGHYLSSAAILHAKGYASAGPELTAWRQFFRHYLIARQLHDDAHDWADDLAAGQLSVVVVWLLADFKHRFINLVTDMPQLRQLFWRTTVTRVYGQVQHHIAVAESALAACDAIVDKQRYQGLLNALQAAAQLTVESRAAAVGFIESFQSVQW